MKETEITAKHEGFQKGMLLRAALSIPEVRNGVRDDLRALGKLPYFSRERIAAIAQSLKTEYEPQK